MILTTVQRQELRDEVDRRRRSLLEERDQRSRRTFVADRDMCDGWSFATSEPCKLFARKGARYCRYHESDA